MTIVYLHGFASSPESTKAQFFKRHLEAQGAEVRIPRLDEGNFEAMTISGQLRVVERTAGPDSVVLMGSSLGGYLSALYAARHPRQVERLVLLAPAFQFPARWKRRFSDGEWDEWRSAGSKPFFHYGYKEEKRLGYGFVEDAVQYEDEPDVRQPVLIFHGTLDDVVPAEVSERFVATHRQMCLRLMKSGHELTDVLDAIWPETAKFLGFQKL